MSTGSVMFPRIPGWPQWIIVVVVALTLVVVSRTAAAEDARAATLDVAAVPEYAEGKFGTRHTTQILYAPLTTQWSPIDDLEIRLTLPFLWERGHTILALVGGGIGGIAQRVRVRDAHDRALTAEGLGDTLLEIGYTVLDQTAVRPEITPFAQIKFPTADSRRGLGTGAFDETLGVELIKRVANDWSASAELGYTFVGSPSRVHLDDSFAWLLGIRYDVTKPLTVGAFLEGATAIAPHEEHPLEARVEVEYRIAKRLTVLAGVTRGLNNASPSFGMAAGVRYRFR